MAGRSRSYPHRPALIPLLVAAALCSGFLATHAAAAPTADQPVAPGQVLLPPPDDRVYLAANPGFGPTEDRVSAARVRAFERLSGRRIAWAYFSNNWFDGIDFPAAKIDSIYRAGRIPFVRLMARSSWRERAPDRRYTLQSIIDGRWDGRSRRSQGLRSWCRQAAALDRPLLAEFGTEVNGDWFPWSGRWNGAGRKAGYGDPREADGPERFRDAYRHIITLCRKQGAGNVTWFFHPDADSEPAHLWNRAAAYYPGPAYIDWLGLSFYGSLSNRWRTEQLRAGLDRALPRLAKLAKAGQKPLALLEWGTREEARRPRSKARWIRTAARDLRDRYPKLDAIAWWHGAYEDAGEHVDLRIDSSPHALEAYRRLVAGEGFATRPFFGERQAGAADRFPQPR